MERLQALFIKTIADEKGITHEEAIEFIEECINKIVRLLKIPYPDVYRIVYGTMNMEECLRGKCSDLDLESCRKSCMCVEIDGKCYPRKFEDATKMNDDPDTYVQGMSTENLTELVRLASYLYYNYDGGGLTDNTFDALEYHLNKRLKARGRRYEKIGAPPVDKIRVPLPYPMPSLNKAKPGTQLLFDFLYTGNKGIVWALKLDGVSGMVVYKNGSPSALYTRGDGTIGGDISYLINNGIVFPALSAEDYANIVVRGEFILEKEVWETKYKGSYSNARSFVSAKINSGHKVDVTGIKFVAYEIIDLGDGGKTSSLPKPSEMMTILASQGFTVVQHGILASPTMFDVIQLYKDLRKTAPYYIDGLVLSLDQSRGVITKLANPAHSIAFKMRLEEQIRSTKVLNIEWNISRYGRLIPVAIFESVYIDGMRYHRASAFNATRVVDWNLGKGSLIKIVRSGDVIPTIIDVTPNTSIEPILPPVKLGWHWKNKDIILNDIEGNQTVQIRRIEHFFVTIGVPRLREKTIEKLWEVGLKTIKDFTQSTPTNFMKAKGVGKKSGQSFYDNIHETLRKTRIDRFIPASTTLELGIGRKLIKQVMRYYPAIIDDTEEKIKVTLKRLKIKGIGPQRINNIASNMPKFKKFIYSLSMKDVKYAIKQDQLRAQKIEAGLYNKKIKGKTFIFTGFMGHTNYELEDFIYDNLGEVGTDVTSSTEAVIAANLMEVSKKMEKAHSFGIGVYSLDEFARVYDWTTKKSIPEEDEKFLFLE